MALATTRYRDNYPSAKEGVPDTVRISGTFTTNGASSPTVKSSGPWSVARTGVGTLVVTLTENCAEFLAGDCGLWTTTANANQARIRSDGMSTGSSALSPASFTIETQSVAGTAADLTGPIVSFDIAYRKGILKNR